MRGRQEEDILTSPGPRHTSLSVLEGNQEASVICHGEERPVDDQVGKIGKIKPYDAQVRKIDLAVISY